MAFGGRATALPRPSESLCKNAASRKLKSYGKEDSAPTNRVSSLERAILCDFCALVPQSVRQWFDMFLAEVDTSKRLMTMSFAQHVALGEMKSCLEKVRGMLVDIKPGFRLLTDLSSLESMDASCATDLGEMMSLCNGKGIGVAVRVVPDPRKDIGFTLMSQFHYGKHVEVTTYETLADAVQSLAT